MSLLQDPLAAIAQAEWYLAHSDLELFPGAFELAAGNLCRQTIEQALLIGCFFSGMPQNRYLRPNRSLQVAGRMLRELNRIEPPKRIRYWTVADRRGPRIAKLVRERTQIAKWAKLLNEPSHFSTRHRRVGAPGLREFVEIARRWFDEKDKYLIVFLLNEIFSKGRFRVVLGPAPDNTPGVSERIVLTARDFHLEENGRLALRTPKRAFVIVSSREVPRGPWPATLVLVEHTVGVSLAAQLVTRRGNPVNLSSMETVILSFASTRSERAALAKRMRQLGLELQFTRRRTVAADAKP